MILFNERNIMLFSMLYSWSPLKIYIKRKVMKLGGDEVSENERWVTDHDKGIYWKKLNCHTFIP